MEINQTEYIQQSMAHISTLGCAPEPIRNWQRKEGEVGTRKMSFRHDNQEEPSTQAQGPK